MIGNIASRRGSARLSAMQKLNKALKALALKLPTTWGMQMVGSLRKQHSIHLHPRLRKRAKPWPNPNHGGFGD